MRPDCASSQGTAVATIADLNFCNWVTGRSVTSNGSKMQPDLFAASSQQ